MSDQAVTPPINEENLKGFPPRAILALVLRNTWRCLPTVMEVEKPRQDLLAALLAMTGEALWERLPDEQLLAFLEEQATVLPTYVDALLERVRGLSDLADENEWIEAALHSILGPEHDLLGRVGGVDLAAAAGEQLREDADWLRQQLGETGRWEMQLLPGFLEIPLWQNIPSGKQPQPWEEILAKWYAMMEKADPPWLGRQYRDLMSGKGVDPRAQADFLSEWLASQDALASPEEKKSEPPSIDIDEPQQPADDDKPHPQPPVEPPLIGGIVTAAADTPTTVDQLGRTPLVHTLADMLASPSQSLPMTIALLGDWGSGKSSVIAQLRERLDRLAKEDRGQYFASGEHKRNQYLFAEFNAWEYEETDNLRAGLAQEVVNGLTTDLDRWDKLRLALTKSAKGNTWEFYMTLGGLALALVGLIFGVNLASSQETDTALKAAELLSGGGVVAFSAYLLLQVWRTGRRLLEHPLATQMATYLKLPSYGKHLGEVPVIKREIRELCRERLASLTNGRLLVVVDDLDRCHPSAVTETLDAIRLVMNLEQVAVIVAVDDRIAFRAVADHYAGLAGDGRRSKEEIARDYLGKIIQLPVNLYDPWPNEVTGFIRGHLFQVAESEEATAGIESPVAGHAPSARPTEAKSLKLTEAAQRLAAEEGVDASVIPASGKDGSVTQADVQRYLREASREVSDLEEGAGQDDLPPREPPPEGTESLQDEAKSQMEQQEELEELMQDTAQEQELFASLTTAMGLSNPRQLIRLRNSYRLLKGYRHSRGSEVTWPLLEKLMHCLFWYEFLYQKKLEARQHAELVMWLWGERSDWQAEAESRHSNPPLVNMAQRLWQVLPRDEWGKEYGVQMKTVAMVVLPNAEMALTLDRPRAEALLRSKRKDEGIDVEPAPWRGGYRPLKQKAS